MNSFLIKYFLFIFLLLVACSSDDYESVRIGNQVWMARNLNRDIGGSFCYDNDSLNCEKYGRLYTWKAAQNACPEQWRLPTHADFLELEKNAEGIDSGNVASVLKSPKWESSGKKNGFNAIPAGYGFFTFRFYLYIKEKKMEFVSQSGTSMFWSSTGVDSIAELWYLTQGEKDFFYSRSSFMNYGLFILPVRCIKSDSNVANLSKNDSIAMLEKRHLIEYWEQTTMRPYFQSCSERIGNNFLNYFRFLPPRKETFYINNDLLCPNNWPCGDVPECQKFCKGADDKYYVLHGDPYYYALGWISKFNLKENRSENYIKLSDDGSFDTKHAKRIECTSDGVNVVYYQSRERYNEGNSEFFSYDKFQ